MTQSKAPAAILFLLFFCVLCFTLSGQNKTVKNDTLLTGKVWLGHLLLGPGVSYEKPISPKWTIRSRAGVYGSAAYRDFTGVSYILGPFLDLQVRQYFTIRRRALRGKRIRYNSAEYLGVKMLNYFPAVTGKNKERFPNSSDNILMPGVVLGHQRIWRFLGYFVEASILVPVVNTTPAAPGIFFDLGFFINLSGQQN